MMTKITGKTDQIFWKYIRKDQLDTVEILVGKEHYFLPTIIAVKKVFEGGIVLEERVEGVNLEEYLLKENTEFLEEEILEIGIQLCDALHFLHSNRPPIIHGDVKPENIMISMEKPLRIRLIDVDEGVVWRTNERNRYSRGTIGYCSPEQRRGEAFDVKSDIYSLGKTLEFLYFGCEKKWKNRRLKKVINKATATREKDRYVTVLEMQQDLRTILYGR